MKAGRYPQASTFLSPNTRLRVGGARQHGVVDVEGAEIAGRADPGQEKVGAALRIRKFSSEQCSWKHPHSAYQNPKKEQGWDPISKKKRLSRQQGQAPSRRIPAPECVRINPLFANRHPAKKSYFARQPFFSQVTKAVVFSQSLGLSFTTAPQAVR